MSHDNKEINILYFVKYLHSCSYKPKPVILFSNLINSTFLIEILEDVNIGPLNKISDEVDKPETIEIASGA